ncbi:MAG: shikimate kinase [Candidatus Hodarchaeota archaeon]
MSKDSIALIGFMATGKSTVGRALAQYLGDDYKFLEIDQLIVQKTGKSIPQIFEEEGESKFREYESSVCKEVSELNKVVISCGGGVVLNKLNIENLKKNCYIVLLKANFEEIYNRILENGKEARPIVNKEDTEREIVKILNFRKPYYETAAEIVIDTSEKRIQNIVREIVIKTQLKS